jgi:hypothetical protein
MFRSGVYLSMVVGCMGWGRSEATPGSGWAGPPSLGVERVWDGFPPEGTEFLLINAGYSVCLTAMADGRGEGLPCDWEDPGPWQRWRHEQGRLVSVASGACLLAPGLTSCEEATRFDVSYDLLEERLLLGRLQPPRAAGCFLVREEWGGGDAPSARYPLGFAPLGPGGCGESPLPSKWVIIPVHS